MKRVGFLSLVLLNTVLGTLTPVMQGADYFVAGFAVIGIAAAEYWMISTGILALINSHELNLRSKEMERRIREMRSITLAS